MAVYRPRATGRCWSFIVVVDNPIGAESIVFGDEDGWMVRDLGRRWERQTGERQSGHEQAIIQLVGRD